MKYQNFVIKNGKFIGKFEEMYRKISDPWNLLKKNNKTKNLNYQVIYNYCEQIQIRSSKKLTTLEIGCGFPQISYELYLKKFKVYGTDISKTVIEKSKIKYPKIKNNLFVSNFLNFSLYEKLKPDIIILSDISWYVLPDLKRFIKWYKNLKKKLILFIHLQFMIKVIKNMVKNIFMI